MSGKENCDSFLWVKFEVKFISPTSPIREHLLESVPSLEEAFAS